MKKFMIILSSVSIAALIGFSNVTLADEDDEAKNDQTEVVQEKGKDAKARPQQGRVLTDSDSNEGDDDIPKPQKNFNSSKSNTVTAITGDDDDDDEGDDIVQGSGDPMKGLLGGKGKPCKPCDVDLGGTVSTGDDEGDAATSAGKKNDLPEQASDRAREATSKEKKAKKNKKKKKDKKKDDDG